MALDAFVDGRIAGELGPEGDIQLDVVVMAEPGAVSPTNLLAMPLATPTGEVVPLSTVTRTLEVLSPTSIERIERARAITLEISPAESRALETAMDSIRNEVLPDVFLPDGVDTRLSGAAVALDEAQRRFASVLWLATDISFLLKAEIFEDSLAPPVILVTLPLAGSGRRAWPAPCGRHHGLPASLAEALGAWAAGPSRGAGLGPKLGGETGVKVCTRRAA